MTSQEPKTPQFVDHDIPDTEVIVVSAPAPVFVDSTGRRRKVFRRLAYAFGALCMLYGGLVSVSLAGGPVSSSAVLPLPDLHGDDDEIVEARPSPTPIPTVTTAPQTRFLTEALRRPVSDRDRADDRRSTGRDPGPHADPGAHLRDAVTARVHRQAGRVDHHEADPVANRVRHPESQPEHQYSGAGAAAERAAGPARPAAIRWYGWRHR